MLSRSSKSRLNAHAIAHFEGSSLFARVARAVCAAECLPRKELYEAWETARRVRRRFRGGRVVDLAAGHGLLAALMLILDDTSPEAIAVDTKIPKSAARVAHAMEDAWPRLRGRIHFVESNVEDQILHPSDVVVSVHACGALTDRILDAAASARSRVAVLPCCHDLKRAENGGLEGWLAGSLAIDVERAVRLRAQNYSVFTQLIPSEITPKNRLLLGAPLE
jgi:hypothetical protein